MADEILKQLNQGKESRLVIPKGNQIDSEHSLHLGMLIKVIEDNMIVMPEKNIPISRSAKQEFFNTFNFL